MSERTDQAREACGEAEQAAIRGLPAAALCGLSAAVRMLADEVDELRAGLDPEATEAAAIAFPEEPPVELPAPPAGAFDRRPAIVDDVAPRCEATIEDLGETRRCELAAGHDGRHRARRSDRDGVIVEWGQA